LVPEGRKKAGYTLIELLLALLLTTVLITAAFSALQSVQIWSQNLDQLVGRDENLRTAPILLVRWIAHAGANRHSQRWPGISLGTGTLQVQSDFDGEAGFPNGKLTESFENLSIRLMKNELQVRSGSGNFQPFLKQITAFDARLESPSLLLIELNSTTSTTLAGIKENRAAAVALRTWLPNYASNLFPEKLP